MPRALAVLAALALLLGAACGVNPDSAPTFTPDPALAATAAVLFPAPLPTATLTPTPVARGDAAAAIARLLDAMQIAVLAQDAEAYLALIDRSDPVFALEQARWVEDWDSGQAAVTRFSLSVRNLTIDGDQATGDLTMAWTVLAREGASRGADFRVRFIRAADGRWRYAGEAWTTLDGQGFRVRAAPGQEAIGEAVAAMMPGVTAHVTASLGFSPVDPVEIKLYDNPWSMIATIRLSLLNRISGWNEPGEALKLLAEDIPAEAALAHELTHHVLFAAAGEARGMMPWWLAEGMAEYVASDYWTFTERRLRLAQARQWQQTGGLVTWEAISRFEDTPERLWSYVYIQGYAFARYVTETYGAGLRNEWLRAMADASLEEATPAVLGMPFEELDAGFLGWLAAQD